MDHERVTRVHVIRTAGRERAARWYRWMATQPSWVGRAAAMAALGFLFVIGLPILLFVLMVALVGAVVFATLATAHSAFRRLRGASADKGRKNVVVRRRSH